MPVSPATSPPIITSDIIVVKI